MVLSQCFSRQKVAKIGMKQNNFSVISYITTGYETLS